MPLTVSFLSLRPPIIRSSYRVSCRSRSLHAVAKLDANPFSHSTATTCRAVGTVTSTSSSRRKAESRWHPTINRFQVRYSSYLKDRYHELVHTDDVQLDKHQLRAIETLERLRNNLLATDPAKFKSAVAQEVNKEPKEESSLWNSWFGSSKAVSTIKQQLSPSRPSIQGAYLHGGVGCGKTFLMHLFHDSLDDTLWAAERQKIHFHKFMLSVHQQMHEARYKDVNNKNHTLESDAILPAVIKKMAGQGRLLCLDEFQVTDVADALILQRLFTGLWHDYGCILVATSNRPPEKLYWNGLQRDRFLPFIDLLSKQCEVISMWASETDYRLVQKSLSEQLDRAALDASATSTSDSLTTTTRVFFGKDKESRKAFDRLFYQLVGSTTPVAPKFLEVSGRKVRIPLGSFSKGIARFGFEDLCQKALGAADYLQIGKYFHTVFVEHIPEMNIDQLNWIRRFITFVDSMYESKVKLVLQGPSGNPSDIFPRTTESNAVKTRTQKQEEQLTASHDEVFAFDRTVSRLEEMSSTMYLKKRWAGSGAVKEKSKTLTSFFEPQEHHVSDDEGMESKAALLSRGKVSVYVEPS